MKNPLVTKLVLLTGLSLILSLAPEATQAAAKKKNKAEGYPPTLADARTEIYKTIGDTKLQLYIFTPKNHQATDHTPAIVFFFGGAWTSGSPKQFEQHCRYLASRGMVAITTDYRVASRQQVKPVQCVADAKSAMRWVRKNAARLGIDPQHIAAGGGSAGGHLAGAVAFLKDLDEPGEDTAVSCVPNALVMFNPALVLAPLDGKALEGFGSKTSAERFGTEPENISPAHHVGGGAPPAIIFHGRADTTVPFVTVEWFADKMKAAGNHCELIGFDGQKHGFFNFGRNENKFFLDTLKQTDQFLVSLGYLSGTDTVDKFFAQTPEASPKK
jgi:acetyl esterase